jgi:hypothetical protein
MVVGPAAVMGDDNSTKSTFPIEYEMSLQPFQVLLQYDDSFPMPKSDEMIVLSSTQYYLETHLRDSEPDFLRITLYQYVRDYVMESRQHFSKIAMNGMVYFSTPITEDRRNRVQQDLFKKMSIGADDYVSILHEEEMDHVVNATLLSIQGNEMMYEDGKMIEMAEPERNDGPDDEVSRDMGDDMRNKVLLLCLLVPGLAIIAAAIVFIVRMAREINWNCSAPKNESLWQRRDVSHRPSARRGDHSVNRRKITDIEALSDISSETGPSDT